MRRFTALYEALDATTSTSEKTAHLEAYFRSAPAEDAAVALYFLLGHRVKGAPTTNLLRALASETTGLPAWMVDECYGAVGDLSETIALLAPGPDASSDESLRGVFDRRVRALVSADEPGRKRIILDAWASMSARERFVYHKLIRGGFRVGVQARLVARALAAVAGVPAEVMGARLTAYASHDADDFRALLRPEGAGDPGAGGGDAERLRPYPFFLARQLDPGVDPAEALGDAEAWWAEWKWDGIRCQIVRRATDAGPGVALWSRGEELITHQFPEIAAASGALAPGTVLDGEILAWTGPAPGRGGRPRPFAALQRRLNRKAGGAAQIGLFEQHAVRYLAYDALEAEGRDLRALPLRERRAAMEAAVRALGDEGPLHASERVRARDWSGYATLRAESRERGVEGLMLKRPGSRYGAGRVDPTGVDIWWKWKVDPFTIDAVLVYAQVGSGKRASLLTDYTFALWDRPAGAGGERTLTPFAKAYSGLTQAEIEAVDAILRKTTRARRGPMREVEPTLVFELAFEGVQRSGRRRAGLSVRFPRMHRWRRDKPPEEADTLADLAALLPAEEREG